MSCVTILLDCHLHHLQCSLTVQCLSASLGAAVSIYIFGIQISELTMCKAPSSDMQVAGILKEYD